MTSEDKIDFIDALLRDKKCCLISRNYETFEGISIEEILKEIKNDLEVLEILKRTISWYCIIDECCLNGNKMAHLYLNEQDIDVDETYKEYEDILKVKEWLKYDKQHIK